MHPTILEQLEYARRHGTPEQEDALYHLMEVLRQSFLQVPLPNGGLPPALASIRLSAAEQRAVVDSLVEVFLASDDPVRRSYAIFAAYHADPRAMAEPLLRLFFDHRAEFLSEWGIGMNAISAIEDCMFFTQYDLDARVMINDMLRTYDPRPLLQYWIDHPVESPVDDPRAERCLANVEERIAETPDDAADAVQALEEQDRQWRKDM